MNEWIVTIKKESEEYVQNLDDIRSRLASPKKDDGVIFPDMPLDHVCYEPYFFSKRSRDYHVFLLKNNFSQ